jgi:hypothetical protein
MPFINVQNGGVKIVKNDAQNDPLKLIKKVVKICYAMGGSKMIKNRLFWVWGPRGPIL